MRRRPPRCQKEKEAIRGTLLEQQEASKVPVHRGLAGLGHLPKTGLFCTKNVIHLLPLRWAHFGPGDCPIFYFPALDEDPDQCSPSHWEVLGTSCSWGGQMPLGLLMDSLDTWTAPALGVSLLKAPHCIQNLWAANLSPCLLED